MSPQILSMLYYKSLPLIKQLPPLLQVKIASRGREYFMQQFIQGKRSAPYVPDAKLSITMWGIYFRTNLANAAGMFKNGDGYDTVASIGAGAYIGGTSTNNPRLGNSKHNIKTPFINLHDSHMAINWLGLPNIGDEELSKKVITRNKIEGCPIGWSVMRSPDYDEATGLNKLIESLWLYHNNSQIDFIEINESCPNIKSSGGSIIPRLEFIAKKFLNKKQRHLPVIVKLPHDLTLQTLEPLVSELVRLNFDGVNIGNTSTSYADMQKFLRAKDKKIFDYFTGEFGGGVSGLALKNKTLELCGKTVELVHKLKPTQEFHVIRTGGVDTAQDIFESNECGVSFNNWYTGFFEQYIKSGDNVYRKLYESF